jgi:hypothetical protein
VRIERDIISSICGSKSNWLARVLYGQRARGTASGDVLHSPRFLLPLNFFAAETHSYPGAAGARKRIRWVLEVTI